MSLGSGKGRLEVAQKDDASERTACSSCGEASCSAKTRRPEETEEQFAERQALQERMCKIKHKVLVLSGKGGVGKSTVAVNIAVALAAQGRKVGLLDIDIHGPNVPKMLGLEGKRVGGEPDSLEPYPYSENLRLMSIGFLLHSPDSAVIWRGPLKYSVIKQFLKDVEWGELDYLVVDAPPGTGDEPLSICQLIEDADGAVVVTTPQEVSILDVRKCVNFCRQLKTPILGVVENMSGFVCPHCGKTTDLFKKGGGERMAAELGVPFLGAVPFDPAVVEGGDGGTPVTSLTGDTPTKRAFLKIVEGVVDRTNKRKQGEEDGNGC
jgi:ATP-binding protein involved in chromosome partitioning